MNKNKTPWYTGGLHFECQRCGRCCSGPSEGYIWVTKSEIELIADFLKMSVGQVRRDYLKRVAFVQQLLNSQTPKTAYPCAKSMDEEDV